MPRKPKEGNCVHCAKFFKKLTWDHVFPISWYPESTLLNLTKWKVPSCYHCNKAYGKLENDIMIRIGLCLDPLSRKSLGIPDKAIRAIDPTFGKNDMDKKRRQAKREQILRESIFGENIPDKGIYPNFGNTYGLPKKDLIAIKIKPDNIERLTEKIVRGITYLEDNLLITNLYEILFYTLEDRTAEPVVAFLKKIGKVYAREPGIEVIRAVQQEGTIKAFYSISIWGKFKMYAAVRKK